MPEIVRTSAHALILRNAPLVKPDTDTGARLISGQVATAVGESFDKKWLYILAPAGNGWASVGYLSRTPATSVTPIVVPPRWPRVPRGLAEIEELFGEPCKPLCEAGRVKLPLALPLSWDPTQKVTRFACHELVAPVFESVFKEIHRRDFWKLLVNFGGCYNCREQRGADSKRSTHAWGIGIDLNTEGNELGVKPTMPEPIIKIFADHGFVWGGTWKRPDGMHFQYATGY